jgi:NAD(P)-dependent dehydrogenase (short-subunit alcohol dehydrogenase family)
MAPLEGLVAVVTGGGRGIGRAHCERLAAYGARVVINDAGVSTSGETTTETPAEEVAAGIRARGGDAIVHTGDVASSDTGRALVAAALDAWGRLDIVIANAGFGRARMAFNLEDPDWDAVIGVHLRGTFATAQPALQHWRAQAKEAGGPVYGRLLTTSTGLLISGGAGQSNYVAAKAGVLAFTEAVATEMAPYGVTANVIMPGANTRLAQVGWRTSRAIESDARHGVDFDAHAPEHVAELACYLASPAAGWINGQTFQVSGGRIQHLQTFAVDREMHRTDRGHTLADLATDIPRLFGAAAHRAEKPPADWQKRR